MLRQQRYLNEGREWEHLQETFVPILTEIATGGIGSIAEGWALEPNNLHCFDFVKDNIYEMYMSNPLENTLDVLANKFRLTKSSLAAIIRGKQMELDEGANYTEEEKADNLIETVDFEDEYEEFFVDDPVERIDPPDQKRRKSIYIAAEADVNSQAAIETMRHAMRHWGVMQPYILPKDPPPEYADQAKSRILREPYFTPEEKKKMHQERGTPEDGDKIFIIDIANKNSLNATREMYVIELDGTIRTPSWTERRFILRPPVRMNLDDWFEYHMVPHWDPKYKPFASRKYFQKKKEEEESQLPEPLKKTIPTFYQKPESS